VNRLKTTPEHFLKIARTYGWRVDPVAISPWGFRLPAGRLSISPGNTPEHEQGLFYLQDLASMLPAMALDPKPGEMVLELGAAPGSKSTQMAEMMENRGCIVAVDISAPRLEILERNARRMGATIIQPTLADGTRLGSEYQGRFDRVLVDGPCSCEGIFRYKPHKLFEWSLSQVLQNAATLEKLLRNAFEALRPDGTLVYSTCTYAPEENEVIIDRTLKRFPSARLLPVPCAGLHSVPAKSGWEHAAFDLSMTHALRCYPSQNNSLGFFVARMERRKV
jgi:NOL1/NOP2/sun family putative RNA methylase